jgi:hypothetical protein
VRSRKNSDSNCDMARDLGLLFLQKHQLQLRKKQWAIAEGSATRRVVLVLVVDEQCNYMGIAND